jgi:hypothetical protein
VGDTFKVYILLASVAYLLVDDYSLVNIASLA